MQITVTHNTYGSISYSESFWTGKRQIVINGVPLIKQKKTLYLWNVGDQVKPVTVKGSYLTGMALVIDGEEIRLTASAKWYEIVLAIFSMAFIIAWGNSVALCSIVPIIGGAIGGAIAGGMGCASLILMKSQKSLAVKLAIWLGMSVAAFLICFILALAFLSALA